MSTSWGNVTFSARDSATNLAYVAISALYVKPGLDDRDSILDRGNKFFSSPQRPDPLWGPPSLLSNGYRGSFHGGKAAGA
jgi:hypothetical protein